MPVFSGLAALIGTTLAATTGTAATGATATAAGAAAGTSAAGGLAGTLSAVSGLAGAGLTAVGTLQQMEGAKKASEAQERAERIRATQMDLEATRQRRQTIRQALIAQGTAMNTAAAQGATEGSGIQGGLAQISGQANTNLAGINASQQLGTQMFAANADYARARTTQSTGSGLASLGGALFSNQQQIGRLGTYLIG